MISVILMAYGSPSKMEDVYEYLEGIYEGKPVPEYALRENTEKYQMVNGISPSNAIIHKILSALSDTLSSDGAFHVVLGNKHWKPSLENAVEEISTDSPDTIVALPLFPFKSNNVKNSYLGPLMETIEKKGIHSEIKFINGFECQGLAEIWAKLLGKCRINEDTAVLFDAHSLPTFGGKEEDYDASFRETARLIARRIPIEEYFVGYQSRGKYGSTWLDPSIYEILQKIKEKGYKKILTVPVGFIYEHLEILYDLDYEFRKRVGEMDIEYTRSDLPNDSKDFITLLRNSVLKEIW